MPIFRQSSPLYRAATKSHLIPFFKDRNIREITAGNIEDFNNSLPVKLQPKSVHNILGILHKVLSDALRRQDIKAVPEFPTVEVPEVKIKWISQEDQEKILAKVKDPIRRAYFQFLMMTGVRPGEGRALKWDDIDFKKGIVTISAAMDEDEFRPYTKERDVRILPLHPDLIAELRFITPVPVRFRVHAQRASS